MIAPPKRELQKAFAIIDASVKAALANQPAPACARGCAHCCAQPIPLSPAEAMLLMEHARFGMNQELKEKMLAKWDAAAKLPRLERSCPLLFEGVCQAYELRPLSCRRFLVSGRQCRPGEDPFLERPGDMIRPSRSALAEANSLLAPWHLENAAALGLPKLLPGEAHLRWLARITTVIQGLDWKALLSARFPS